MHTPADARQRLLGELNLTADEPVIAVIGRVISDKGQDQLINAMPRILAEFPDTKLLIVRDGSGRQEYEALARELNLANAVRFIGQRRDIPAVHKAIDLMVMPSMWEEGFDLAALEAMLSHRPVVAFNTGGIPTIVRDGETGLLVPRADQKALADAVLTLLRDEPRRRQMGKQGCEHALSFSIDKHVANMLRIYCNVIEARRK